ncbi:hypothetical protein BDW74DRAFT_157211 [Aspergillus multicolor]|uniref:nucleoporin FG repeat-containing protein n=1 Tax=Aspergillus multicolor TaxID=41759 RepID=UPI003CCCF0C2
MFSSKPAAPSTGLSINTNSANSLFGGNTSATTPASTGASGGLFGTAATQSKPAGGLFGNTGTGNTQQTQNSGSSLFSGLGGQQNNTSGTGMFGNTTATTQPQSGGLFSGTAGANNTTTQTSNTGGLFGNMAPATTTQTESKPAFSLGSTTTGTSIFGTNTNAGQAQKPTLSLFGTQNTTTQQPTQQAPAAGASTVIQGAKVDLTNILPTTKYESCADEVKSDLEFFDTFILTQIKMCNEVASILPLVSSQGSTIPNDVEYVQGKLETMQHALENDATDIDQLRSLVSRDAAEAEVAFRSIDTLKLPMQYQSTGGSGWWSAQDHKVSEAKSMRSTRKNTLALPDDVEGDPSTSSINGVPVNLVEYFTKRSDEMGEVLERYTRNLKEIEDHLHGVESTLERQIHEFTTARNRDSAGNGAPRTVLNDLAAVLGDVETGILGVASRLGAVSEQAQEVVLGAPSGLRQA